MVNQKRPYPESTPHTLSSSLRSRTASPHPNANQRNVQRRSGQSVREGSSDRTRSSTVDSANEALQNQIIRSIGIVANKFLFDVPKGLEENTVDTNNPINTLGDYCDVFSVVKNVDVSAFSMDMTPYNDVLNALATKEDLSQICSFMKNRKPLGNASKQTYDELVDACTQLSRDVVHALLEQIDFKKSSCGFALVQSAGPDPDTDKTCESLAITLALQRQLFSRVLVINWDSDHWAKLENDFYDRSEVLCISLHRYNGNIKSGFADRVGAGEGVGKNVNCPFPLKDFNANDLLYAFQHLVMPIALEFQPNVVLVATSLDFHLAHENKSQIPPEVYGQMLFTLQSLACGKVAVSLECSHTLEVVAPSVYSMVDVFLGLSPTPMSAPVIPSESGATAVATSIRAHAPFWHSLSHYKQSNDSDDEMK